MQQAVAPRRTNSHVFHGCCLCVIARVSWPETNSNTFAASASAKLDVLARYSIAVRYSTQHVVLICILDEMNMTSRLSTNSSVEMSLFMLSFLFFFCFKLLSGVVFVTLVVCYCDSCVVVFSDAVVLSPNDASFSGFFVFKHACSAYSVKCVCSCHCFCMCCCAYKLLPVGVCFFFA